jgi:hypothetical protein
LVRVLAGTGHSFGEGIRKLVTDWDQLSRTNKLTKPQ